MQQDFFSIIPQYNFQCFSFLPSPRFINSDVFFSIFHVIYEPYDHLSFSTTNCWPLLCHLELMKVLIKIKSSSSSAKSGKSHAFPLQYKKISWPFKRIVCCIRTTVPMLSETLLSLFLFWSIDPLNRNDMQDSRITCVLFNKGMNLHTNPFISCNLLK